MSGVGNNPGGPTAAERHEKRKAQKKQVASIILITLEVVILIGVICVFFHFFTKLQNRDFDDTKPAAAATEKGNETASGSVNVNNDKFALTCNKVQIVRDVDGRPVALIYFTFTNKLSEPLSMSDVFPPSVKQNGSDCETFATLEDAPDELYDRDLQISDGQSVECCYAVGLFDTTETITLTIHDNYDTFTDIGSVDIPLQSTAPDDPAEDAGTDDGTDGGSDTQSEPDADPETATEEPA